MYVPLCVLVFMCVPLWFAYACVYCLPGRRLLWWAEDAFRHPLAPLQLLQITIYQPLTFIFIFPRFLLVHCFCDFFFCFCYACKLCPCMFFVFVKAFVPPVGKQDGRTPRLQAAAARCRTRPAPDRIVSRLERYMIMHYVFIQHMARSPSTNLHHVHMWRLRKSKQCGKLAYKK